MNELDPLDAYCAALIAKLQPGERRILAREISKQLRSNQVSRIAAQLNPDGSPYAPRKPQKLRTKKGRIRRTMFAKIRTAKYLKANASPDAAIVSFTSQVQRIAQVHQFGLRDKVNRRKNLEVDYPVRKLLGITTDDVSLVEEIALKYLSA